MDLTATSTKPVAPQPAGTAEVVPVDNRGVIPPTPELAFAEHLERVLTSADRPTVADALVDAASAPARQPSPIAFTTRLVPAGAAALEQPAEQLAEQAPQPVQPKVSAASVPSDVHRETGTPAATEKQPVRRVSITAQVPGGLDSQRPATVDTTPRTVPAPQTQQTRTTGEPAAPEAAPVHPPATLDVPPNEPKPTPIAHEIRLQLNGGDQRVEVRVVDRGGDVQVAVRTPDGRLAGALREDLPALSARLEQTGYRAETWHVGPSVQERQPGLETAAGATAQQQQNRSNQERGQQQQDGRQQQPKDQENPQRKNDRKDFSWLFTSLR